MSTNRVLPGPIDRQGMEPPVARQSTRGKIDARAQATIKSLQDAKIRKAGSLTFPNTDKKPAKFAEMPAGLSKEQINNAIDVLQEVWRMPRANVLISVTGGAQAFKLDKRLTASFQRGLRSAVRTTKACVVTGGTKCGCMELVGKTLEDEEHIVLLGVAPYNKVSSTVKVATLAAPEHGPCASSGHAWRGWPVQGERPGRWAPSRCPGCSSEPHD